jgi:hypothetical protein
MEGRSQELFERVLAYCGLSALIGPGILRRAMSESGVDPDAAAPQDYAPILPGLAYRLRTFVPVEEAERRVRRLALFLEGAVMPEEDARAARLPALQTPSLHARVTLDGARLRIALVGSTDLSSSKPLATFLADVHEAAVRIPAETVVLDLLDFYFLHTSCVKQLVIWFATIAALPPARRYRVQLEGTRALPWQARSLEVLRAAGGADFVSLRID